MPRSTREWALRKLQQSQDAIDWSVYHLGEVGMLYQEKHPEIADPLAQCTVALIELKAAINKVRGSF